MFFVWTKEATFLSADGCSKRPSDFSIPGYQLPEPAEAQWWKKTEQSREQRGMVEKLNVILKNVKEHNFTPFQSSGLALKQGEEFAHSFNVKQIECI